MDINFFAFEKYIEIIEDAKALKIKKMKDYNSGKIHRFKYALHGDITFIDELYKKVLRLKSLNDSKTKPNNESVTDTLIDIINYAGDYYAYREYKKLQMKNQKTLKVK